MPETRYSMHGPYVGAHRASAEDEEIAVEMSITRTRTSGPKPKATAVDMMKALIPAAIMILAILWINASHIFGLFHNQGEYVKRVKVAVADFDGGDFGTALRIAAVANNQSYEFPTYINVDTSSTSPDQIRQDVFDGKYWAAIVVQAGATARFDEAVNGTTSSYDPSDVYTYYLLTARYYTLYAGGIQSSTITTANAAAGIFSAQFIGPKLGSGEFANTTVSLSALTTPARAVGASASIHDFSDIDDKAFLNTIGAVFPILMQFFFIMAWNGICNGMHLYAAYDIKTHIYARLFWSIFWPLICGLCSTGWMYAFRGSYPLDAKMFFATWAVTWVFAMINFDVLDIITGFVPIAFVTFCFLTWVIFNVAAAIGAPDLLNSWYRINYFFPSLHWYQTLITIITSGAVNKLHYTLPTLAGWLVLMKALSPFATRYRINKAKNTFRYLHEKDALDAPH
ncbi:hypothetical protein BKA59DRAFT_466807 [Fusarium tricinctum]|uniref:DUF3533 domain-containing protein n=1 Tax=Fusarium tricinctum TaxID=61284 RepID=A0A8K0S1P9_9HYPO|nr:hypothetical protein BKA59DRAFT_466807 [Fusarium tricinctum]